MPRRNNNPREPYEQQVSIDLAGWMRLMEAFAQSSSVINTNEQERQARVNARRNRRRRRDTVRRITRRTFSQNPNRILDELRENNSNAVVLDGLDNALIGISENGLAVYEKNLIIDILVTRDEMSYEEAVEFYDYNIAGLGGENMPVLVDLGWSSSDESIADDNEPKKPKQPKEPKNPTQDRPQNTIDNGPIESLEL